MQVIIELSHHLEGEPIGIESEDLSCQLLIPLLVNTTYSSKIHVVNISPHRLKRNSSFRIIVDRFSYGKSVLIAISAVVEAEAPVRHHDWQSYNFGILLRDSNRGGSSNKVEVQNSSKSIVLQVLILAVSVIDLDVHAVRVKEEHSMRACSPMLEIHGMVAIEVGAIGNGICILRPQSPDIVCSIQTERVRMLTQPIEIWVLWE
jgi:hypothetical protein